MFGNIDPRMMKQAMKRLGIKQEEIDAEEVIIKTKDKEIIIKNPSVMKVNMAGQENFQISGEIYEREISGVKEEDVKMVMKQAGVSEKKAKEVLERNNGDIAKTIMELGEK
jgi:nascent polypeptide-associated complex subunit alpha